MRKWIVILLVLLSVSVGNAIEKAERISDREIIEGLATLKEGQKAMNQRFDEIRGFMVWGFGVTFAGIFSLMGFVLWDRRTALAPAVRRTEELERREEVWERWRKMVDMALKELAGGDAKVAGVLRHVGLL